jgi:4'-phosphopantetheinyl transferase
MRESTGPQPIYLWWLSLQVPTTTLSFLTSLLSPEEVARARQFGHADGSQRYRLVRGYLRLLLASYLHCAPASLRLSQTQRGKPYLDASGHTPPWHFNLSHSGNFVLIALSPEVEVGVDVERLRPQPRALALARRFFAPQESHYLSHCPPGVQEEAFFQYWTAKEAFLKATGQGLAGGKPLSQVVVDLQQCCFLSLPAPCGAPESWQLTLGRFETPYLGAIAYAGKPRPLFYQSCNLATKWPLEENIDFLSLLSELSRDKLKITEAGAPLAVLFTSQMG